VLGDPVSRVLEFEGFIDFVDVGAMSTAPYLDAWISVERELEKVRRFHLILLEVLGSLLALIYLDLRLQSVLSRWELLLLTMLLVVSYTRRCAVSWPSMMLQLY
jgi:membrane protein required for beta-lactamase induction